jgi:MTH538 TIR-like domain (DUF1863)
VSRNVFFSFSYADVINFRVNVVRNSWLMNNSNTSFVDGSIWENAKLKGDSVIKNLIYEGLMRTSVTAVLIGENTANRRWVNYEIIKSFDRGNGIFGVHINRIRSKSGYISSRGLNPLDRLGFEISENGRRVYFFELVNGNWKEYEDLPKINNKKSNTLYFENSFWNGNEFGKFFSFSEKFDTYCWDFDDGQKNFTTWVETAAVEAGR